jgi:cell division protein FtsQ
LGGSAVSSQVALITSVKIRMTSIASVSSNELAQRRQQLRRQRRLRWLQSSWRTLAVTGLAGGLIWGTTLPGWVIRREQVVIEGNQFIPEQTIRALLPIAEPRSLWRIEPDQFAEVLRAKASIADAKVERQLFPPGLRVQVKERRPVAIALPPTAIAQTPQTPAGSTLTSGVGLIDESGVWIPMENYKALDPTLELPTLKIVGRPEQYRHYWTKLYQAVSHSPVKVLEIDWRDSANLILKTELGVVHFGSYGTRFSEQLSMLDRMRQLPSKVRANQIAYIDLRNPEKPSIQLNSAQSQTKSDSEPN